MSKDEEARDYLKGLFKPEYSKCIEDTLTGDFVCKLASKIKQMGECIKSLENTCEKLSKEDCPECATFKTHPYYIYCPRCGK